MPAARTPLALASLVVALVATAPAFAARGETLLISRADGPTGAGGNGDSGVGVISADGRFVGFQSDADNLSRDDNDTFTNVFVRDTQTGTTTLVSRADGMNGAGGDGVSFFASISADGRFVAFASEADNLSAQDGNAFSNIFLRDTLTGTTALVSRATGPAGAGADANSTNAAISADGRFVAFTSDADNLSVEDNNTFINVFVRDTLMGATTLVSRATGLAGAGGDGNSFVPAISADGRFVAFESLADNLSADDNDSVGNIYVRDTQLGTTTLVSRATGPAGAGGDALSRSPAISADGRFVAFRSQADNLSADDNDAFTNLFVRDMLTGTTTLVTRADGMNGAGGDGDSSYPPSISRDGRFVAFASDANNLSADDNDAVTNVFVRDTDLGTTTLVSRATGSAGAGGADDSYAYGSGISGDGRFVTIESLADNLSPDDNDAFYNVFRRDVRGGPPRCADVAQTVVRNGTTAVALPCPDDDGDAVTRAIVSGPAHGTAGALDQATGSVSYTPTPGYAGPDALTFQASDATGESAVATASLTVAGCSSVATFLSVKCRLEELTAASAAGVPRGRLATKLERLLKRASAGVGAAEGLGHTRQGRRALAKAAKLLAAFGHGLGTRPAKKLDPSTVTALRTAAAALRTDVRALRG